MLFNPLCEVHPALHMFNRISGKCIQMKENWKLVVLICKNELWHTCYAMDRVIGYHMYAKTDMHANKFGIICTGKLCFICTPNTFESYLRQNPFFAYQYHEFSFLFGICMRPGSHLARLPISDTPRSVSTVSWWVESAVIEKEDILNMLGWGYSRTGLRGFGLLCVALNQGCPNSVPEGRCPAEFSSNMPQHTCMHASSTVLPKPVLEDP